MAYKIDPKTGKMIEIDNITGQLLNSNMQAAAQTPIPKDEFKPTFMGSVGNVFKSGGRQLLGMAKGAVNLFNPNLEKNTAVNLGRLGLAGVTSLIPGKQGPEDFGKPLVDSYKKDYGSWEGFKRKLYEDPVGVAMDASILLGGVGMVAKGLGFASKSAKLAGVGTKLGVASSAIDPFQAVARATRVGKLTTRIGEGVENMGKGVGVSALKTTPKQLLRFDEATGGAVSQFQAKNNFYGTTEQILKKTEVAIKPVQLKYNSMVRTGEYVPAKGFTDMLRGRADAIIAKNPLDEATAKLASEMKNKAAFVDNKADVFGRVKVDSIVAAKTSAYGKVKPQNLADSSVIDANKEAGRIGIEYLDSYFPGSAIVGRELNALKLFEDMVTQGSTKGQGGKVVGFSRGLVGGAIGGGIGSAFGNPVMGAIGGAIAESAINSPLGASIASKTIQGTGKGIQRLPSAVGDIEGASKYLSRVPESATVGPLQFNNGTTAVPIATSVQNETPQEQNFMRPDGTVDVSKLKKVEAQGQQRTLTGHTPEEIYRAYQKARKANDKGAMKELKEDFVAELSYQKSIEKKDTKPLTGPNAVLYNKASTAVGAINRVKEATQTGTGVIWSKALNPTSQEGRRYGADVTSILDILGYFRTGAAITPAQRKDYIYMLPSPMDDDATVKYKMENLLNEMNGYISGLDASRGSTDIQINNGSTPF